MIGPVAGWLSVKGRYLTNYKEFCFLLLNEFASKDQLEERKRKLKQKVICQSSLWVDGKFKKQCDWYVT